MEKKTEPKLSFEKFPLILSNSIRIFRIIKLFGLNQISI